MSTMAEVIAAHVIGGEAGNGLTFEVICLCGFDGQTALYAEHVAAELAAAGYGNMADAYPIIRDLVDPDDCWFDHHGGCQAHGYLSLEPGETCPQHDAKQWLKANEGGGHE